MKHGTDVININTFKYEIHVEIIENVDTVDGQRLSGRGEGRIKHCTVPGF